MAECCDNCGCDEGIMYIHSQCHPDAPTWVAILDDQIFITCAECNNPITKMRLAKEVVH